MDSTKLIKNLKKLEKEFYFTTTNKDKFIIIDYLTDNIYNDLYVIQLLRAIQDKCDNLIKFNYSKYTFEYFERILELLKSTSDIIIEPESTLVVPGSISHPHIMSIQVPQGMQGGQILQVQTPAGQMNVQIPTASRPAIPFSLRCRFRIS